VDFGFLSFSCCLPHKSEKSEGWADGALESLQFYPTPALRYLLLMQTGVKILLANGNPGPEVRLQADPHL